MVTQDDRYKIIEKTRARIKNGVFVSDIRSFGTREMLYVVWILLEDDPQKHKDVIHELVFRPQFFDHNCPFSIYLSCSILIRYSDVLPNDIVQKLRAFLAEYKDESFEKEWDFVGVNDNMPALHCGAMYMIGKLFGDSRFIDEAVCRMKRFNRMLSRRTFSSEFNSPTYTLMSVFVFAALAETAEEASVRELALALEQKQLSAILAVYYKRGKKAAGPFSRAYTVDETDSISDYDFLYAAVLPDEIAPDLSYFLSDRYGTQKNEVLHDGAYFFQVNFFFYTSCKYHPRQCDVDALLARTYPFEYEGSAEISSSLDMPLDGLKKNSDLWKNIQSSRALYEYPAGVTQTYTYIDREFSLGTCTKEFHNGNQTDSLHIYTGKDKVSFYPRLRMDGLLPSLELNNYLDMGRKFAFAKEKTAIALYKPRICDLQNEKPRLNLVIHDPSDGVSVEFYREKGGRKVALVETEELYLAVCPIGNTFAAAVFLKNEPFKVISFIYEEVADFRTREALMRNLGFVIEVGKKTEITKQLFMEKYSEFKIKDEIYANIHTRYSAMRLFSYENDNYLFECEYSMVSEGVKFFAVEPKSLKCP